MPMSQHAAVRRRLDRLLAVSVLFCAGGLASCQKVEFFEKQYLANALMQFDADPTLDNLNQKVLYSREATTGGIGSGAGGGCGCTN